MKAPSVLLLPQVWCLRYGRCSAAELLGIWGEAFQAAAGAWASGALVDQPVPHGLHRRLGPVQDAQLSHDPLDMLLHRLLGYR